MGDNYISCKAENGSINISEEVISTMVRTAITEIDGVAGISNTAGAELAELIGIKTVSKGIKVQIVDDTIKVDAIILVRYGCNIVNVAKEVQNSVTEVVQANTGIGKAEDYSIFTIPQFSMINKKWLDELGLPVTETGLALPCGATGRWFSE